MDFSVIILASASLPIMIYNVYWANKDKEIDKYYGIFSGIYTFFGAICVAYGFPGNLIMPVAFTIIGFGGLHAFISKKKKEKIVKTGIFVALGLGIYLMGVFM